MLLINPSVAVFSTYRSQSCLPLSLLVFWRQWCYGSRLGMFCKNSSRFYNIIIGFTLIKRYNLSYSRFYLPLGRIIRWFKNKACWFHSVRWEGSIYSNLGKMWIYGNTLQWNVSVLATQITAHRQCALLAPCEGNPMVHYGDVIMSAMASEITSLVIVCSVVCSGAGKKIKAPCHWPLWGEFTGGRWIPCTNSQ